MWQNPRFDSIFTKYSHFVIFYDLHHKIPTYLGILFKSLNNFNARIKVCYSSVYKDYWTVEKWKQPEECKNCENENLFTH